MVKNYLLGYDINLHVLSKCGFWGQIKIIKLELHRAILHFKSLDKTRTIAKTRSHLSLSKMAAGHVI